MSATLFDAGDPVPRSTLRACPACGQELHDQRERDEKRCGRCIALGAEALTIEQAIAEAVATEVIDNSPDVVAARRAMFKGFGW